MLSAPCIWGSPSEKWRALLQGNLKSLGVVQNRNTQLAAKLILTANLLDSKKEHSYIIFKKN